MTDIEPRPEAAVIEFAHELDSQIRQLAQHAHVVLEALYALVKEAQATNIHVALGFPSWTAYLADALDGQWNSLLDRDKRAEAIKYLAGQGMSQRAIARVTGASKGAIHRELDGCPNLGQVITGLDGKSYPRPEPLVPQPGAGESDEEFLARKLDERKATFTIPATIEAADERLEQIDDDMERLEQMQFEIELARFNAAPDGTAEKCAYSVGLWMRHKRRWGRRIYEELGVESVEEFARIAKTPVDGLRELLFDEDEDEYAEDEEA